MYKSQLDLSLAVAFYISIKRQIQARHKTAFSAHHKTTISAALVRPNTQVVSVAGDGGFLFSSQDLETAVRKNLNIIQLIWNDGKYNMVEFQEEMKYKRSSGVDFGPVDFVKYAESFGAKGLRVTNQEELEAAIKEGYETDGPVLIDIPVNYKDNIKLSTNMLPDVFN